MIIDLHFHTQRFSPCSEIALEAGIQQAKAIGLDGICLTEHDVFPDYAELEALENKYDIKIFVGTEINTTDGDLLCFGVDELPPAPLTALEMVDYVYHRDGATIAAHPYRDNNRGIGDRIFNLPHLTAVEAYNGNTTRKHNAQAQATALQAEKFITGSSDAHRLDKIGHYATHFKNPIHTTRDLVHELRKGNYEPVEFAGEIKGYQSIAYRQK